VNDQMSDLVEEREDLTGLGSAVIDNNQRKFINVVMQGESADFLLLERIFEYIDPNVLHDAPPRLQRISLGGHPKPTICGQAKPAI